MHRAYIKTIAKCTSAAICFQLSDQLQSQKNAPPLSLSELNQRELQLNNDLDAILERARIITGSPGLTAAVYYNPSVSHINNDNGNMYDDACSNPELLSQRANNIIPEYVRNNCDSHALAMLQSPFQHSGDIIYSSAKGYSNIELDVSMKPEHRLCIASVSKPIISVLLAKLNEYTLVDYDENIYDILTKSGYWTQQQEQLKKLEKISTKPLSGVNSANIHYNHKHLECPEYLKNITLEKLLSHRGGIRHYANDEGQSTINYPTVFASLQTFVHDENSFEKLSQTNNNQKERFLYTTHGITLASAVAEAVVHRHIFKLPSNDGKTQTIPQLPSLLSSIVTSPLNLSYLTVEQGGITPLKATEYSRNINAELTPAPHINKTNRWGGGGLIADVESIAKLGGALTSCFNQIKTSIPYISKTTWEHLIYPKDNGYGLCFKNYKFIQTPAPLTQSHIQYSHDVSVLTSQLRGDVVGHTGEGQGSSASMIICPQEGISIAILGNQGLSSPVLEKCALEMAVRVKKEFS